MTGGDVTVGEPDLGRSTELPCPLFASIECSPADARSDRTWSLLIPTRRDSASHDERAGRRRSTGCVSGRSAVELRLGVAAGLGGLVWQSEGGTSTARGEASKAAN
jgi:hypothetical protein